MSTEHSLPDIIWMLVCAALVMLMQGGFCCLESGLARAKNSINVAIKNLVDFCIAAAVFWVFGFALMFGASYGGLIGTNHFLLGREAGPWLLSFFIFQMVFCGTATTIISGAVAERMRFRSYLWVSFLVSGIIYPVFGHWVWGGADQGITAGWLGQRGFIDFAGSSVVHSVGGWVSLAAIMILGPRYGRFTDAERPIHGHDIPRAMLGVMLLWFGWFGFNGGSTLAVSDSIPLILLNTNLAAAAGGLASLFIAWQIEKKPDVGQTMNGCIAGLVAITASCHIVEPWAAVVIGVVGGALCTFASYALVKLKIDDAIGAFPVHACAGMWGTLAVGLFGDLTAFSEGTTRFGQTLIQAEGIGVCCLWSFGGGWFLLKALNCFVPLRVQQDHEMIGLNVSEHGASTEIIDLLATMHRQRETGNFNEPVPVEPHTEVGQIAAEYNLVLSRVNSAIQECAAAHGNRILIPGETAEYAFQRVGGEAGAVAFATNIVF